MRRALTLLAVLWAAAALWAETGTALLYYNATTNSATMSGTELGTGIADGWKLEFTADPGTKTFSAGTQITVEGKKYKPIKLSNGKQYRITLPDGLLAKGVTLYTVVNDDSGATNYWAEIGGVQYESTDPAAVILSEKNWENPTAISAEFQVPLQSFTFRNSGKQPLVVIKVDWIQAGKEAELKWSQQQVTLDDEMTEWDFPTLSNPYGVKVSYSSSDTNVATIDATGVVTVTGYGTTEIKAVSEADGQYNKCVATYALTFVHAVTHDYVVYYGADGETVGTVEAGKADEAANLVATTSETTVEIAQDGPKTYKCFILNNSWAPDANNNYVLLKAEGGFKTGDILTIKAVANVKDTEGTKRSAVKVYDAERTLLAQTPDGINVAIDKETPVPTFSYHLLADTEVIYLGRDGNTKSNIFHIAVQRAKNPIGVPTAKVDDLEVTDEITLTGTEGAVLTLSHDNAQVYFRYESAAVPAASRAKAAAQKPFEPAPTLDHNGKEYTLYTSPITLGDPGTLTYFAHRNGVRSTLSTVSIAGNTTGLDTLAADNAEMPVEYFTLQGVRIDAPTAPGIYIRRQGTAVAKIAVR